MLKQEFKFNFKSFLIWLSITLGMFLLVYLVYPFIVAGDNVKMIDEMIKIFPEEMLKAFNMDISSMDSAYGWLKSEGFVFVLLIIGCYSGVLGSNILVKEESDKTIEYLNSLPIKRFDILKSKVIVGLTNITLLVLILTIFNYIGLTLSGPLDVKQFLLLSITPLFSSIVIFFLSLYISTYFNKTKKTMGISLGIVFISYIINTLSTMSESVEFLKYLSAFTLADIRNVILNVSINPLLILISVIISIILFILTIINYNNKELV